MVTHADVADVADVWYRFSESLSQTTERFVDALASVTEREEASRTQFLRAIREQTHAAGASYY